MTDTPDTGYGRVPPQDLGAETNVLGSMLITPLAIGDAVDIVKGPDFYKPAHEMVFDAIVELYGRGEPADAVTVADELTKRGHLARVGGSAYLHQLVQSVPTAANAAYYAEIVAERAILRRLVEAGVRIQQMGYNDGEGEVSDVLARAQAEVFAVQPGDTAGEYQSSTMVLEKTLSEVEAASTRDPDAMIGVPTGLTDLDELLHGLHPGQLILVAARPSVGKSTLAADFVRSAAYKHGLPSVFFSLEMSSVELMYRFLAAETGIPLTAVRKGALTKENWSKIAAVSARMSGPLYIDDTPGMTLPQIRAKCRRIKQQHGLKLVVVDYLQLLTSGKRTENRQQEVSEFSRALKLLAKELEVPVVAVAQLNRGPEQRADKKPQMSDIRESGSLEQDADVIVLLHRDRDDPTREGEADIIVAKHRNGPTAVIPVAFQGHYARFSNMAAEDGPAGW